MLVGFRCVLSIMSFRLCCQFLVSFVVVRFLGVCPFLVVYPIPLHIRRSIHVGSCLIMRLHSCTIKVHVHSFQCPLPPHRVFLKAQRSEVFPPLIFFDFSFRPPPVSLRFRCKIFRPVRALSAFLCLIPPAPQFVLGSGGDFSSVSWRVFLARHPLLRRLRKVGDTGTSVHRMIDNTWARCFLYYLPINSAMIFLPALHPVCGHKDSC